MLDDNDGLWGWMCEEDGSMIIMRSILDEDEDNPSWLCWMMRIDDDNVLKKERCVTEWL